MQSENSEMVEEIMKILNNLGIREKECAPLGQNEPDYENLDYSSKISKSEEEK